MGDCAHQAGQSSHHAKGGLPSSLLSNINIASWPSLCETWHLQRLNKNSNGDSCCTPLACPAQSMSQHQQHCKIFILSDVYVCLVRSADTCLGANAGQAFVRYLQTHKYPKSYAWCLMTLLSNHPMPLVLYVNKATLRRQKVRNCSLESTSTEVVHVHQLGS